MKRHSRKQAVRRSNESFTERFGGFVLSITDWMGNAKWFYLSLLVALVILTGLLKSMNAPSNAVAMEEHVPDGITYACWSKIVRRGYRETTVDKFEREEMERKLKIADTCKNKDL